MADVLDAISVVIPLTVVYTAVLLARRERDRPRRTGLPTRNWYIAICAAAVVLSLVGGEAFILG